MPIISKLLGLWALGRTIQSTTPLFMRLLASVAAMTLLAAMAALLCMVLIGGTLWIAYLQLIDHNVAPQQAVLLISCAVLAFLSITILYVRHYMRRVRLLSARLSTGPVPVAVRMSMITDAFLDGLLSEQP